LRQFTDARGATVALPASATFSIALIDGRLAIQSDCNRCTGSAAVGSGSLDVGLLACTRAFCSSSPVDTQFESTLTGTHAVSGTDSTLRLASPRGVLDFAR
jgi:heat shock protein HslJ